ncbi:hypothetical protein [Planococcus sp. ISL-110]|uniref:hypothetical protein n=1 Tax=Planococcus sp. ISL-110 TaxID=2819167 RepID=UPI001BE76AF4|nr:hypothetical protein [Planococcus sp. ISL-110]MBT2569234.1 hypothetical protein [Planococcus sp. ISL-110]
MKNDFRMQYPLWMMGFIIALGMFTYGISEPTTKVINTEMEQSIMIEIGSVDGIFAVGSVILYFLMLAGFSYQLMRHNKQNPTQKIPFISFRPPEYLEQDEGMTYITRKASQKVYTFMSWSLPILAIFAMFSPLPRFYTVWGILLVALIQYVIYYLEIRKHFKEETQ